jgi:hypothetical protein
MTCLHREGGEGGEEVVNAGSWVADRKPLCASNNRRDTRDRGSKRLCHRRNDDIDTLWRNDPDLEWLQFRSGDSTPLEKDEEREEEEDCESRWRSHCGNQ